MNKLKIFLLIFIIIFSSQFDCINGDININLNDKRQVIDGFGACSAWQGVVSDQIMKELYETLGYSILRIRIDENKKWNEELLNAKKALQFNAKVFASPWSAPSNMKNNKALLSSQYSNYAYYLKSFVDYMKNNGVNLYAISIINEPDYANEAPYNTMSFSTDEMKDFLKNNAKIIKEGNNIKIMAPETYGYNVDMNNKILSDKDAAAAVDIDAIHGYGFFMSPQPVVKKSGKPFWMTEHAIDGNKWNSVMQTAKDIHDFMTIAEVTAYVHWWLKSTNPSSQNMYLLYQNMQLTPKAFVIGHFAKFIRPGYFRVNSDNSNGNLLVSAYTGGKGKVIIVAINMGKSSISQQFYINGGKPPSSFIPYITSQDKNLDKQNNIKLSEGGSFLYSIPGQSLITFVSV
uniref:Glucosylceramidase n=1 Tax=Meloidogyne hapla TaxID=6305 RepID=A0A1I8BGC9_MELHA